VIFQAGLRQYSSKPTTNSIPGYVTITFYQISVVSRIMNATVHGIVFLFKRWFLLVWNGFSVSQFLKLIFIPCYLSTKPFSQSSQRASTTTPHPWTAPHCATTSRSIAKYYLVVPCLSYSISAQCLTKDLCWHVPGQGRPYHCVVLTWGQVGACSSGVCRIISTKQKQMGVWLTHTHTHTHISVL